MICVGGCELEASGVVDEAVCPYLSCLLATGHSFAMFTNDAVCCLENSLKKVAIIRFLSQLMHTGAVVNMHHLCGCLCKCETCHLKC